MDTSHGFPYGKHLFNVTSLTCDDGISQRLERCTLVCTYENPSWDALTLSIHLENGPILLFQFEYSIWEYFFLFRRAYFI